MTLYHLSPDDETVIRQALDLYQRVAMGQWREILEYCPNVTDQRMFSPAGDALMHIRCEYTTNPHLQRPATHLGIAAAGDPARRAYDLWHLFGGGMEERSGMRLSDTTARKETPA